MTPFEAELEFVECLANPAYLAFLAHQPGVHDDARFAAYLRRLADTWSRPAYAARLAYPAGAAHLRRWVTEPGFGRALGDPAFVQQLHREQYERWAAAGRPSV